MRGAESNIFGKPITAANLESLRFVMEESIVIDPRLRTFTARNEAMQLDSLKAGTYETYITPEYIDIFIPN